MKQSLYSNYVARGYRPACLYDDYNAAALEADRKAIEGRPCRAIVEGKVCGGKMVFHPLRGKRGGYVALAICAKCGDEVKF